MLAAFGGGFSALLTLAQDQPVTAPKASVTVSIRGSINSPGSYEFENVKEVTLGVLIFKANGFKDTAASERTVVSWRDEKGEMRKVVVHFPNSFCGPKNPDPFFLKDGDQVFVPERGDSEPKS